MGAWGYGPYENDSALDWLGDNITDRVEKGLRSKDEAEVRVAAAVITDYLGKRDASDDLIDDAIEKLEQLLDNERWVGSWNEPKKIRPAIKRQISRLKRLRR